MPDSLISIRNLNTHSLLQPFDRFQRLDRRSALGNPYTTADIKTNLDSRKLVIDTFSSYFDRLVNPDLPLIEPIECAKLIYNLQTIPHQNRLKLIPLKTSLVAFYQQLAYLEGLLQRALENDEPLALYCHCSPLDCHIRIVAQYLLTSLQPLEGSASPVQYLLARIYHEPRSTLL